MPKPSTNTKIAEKSEINLRLRGIAVAAVCLIFCAVFLFGPMQQLFDMSGSNAAFIFAVSVILIIAVGAFFCFAIPIRSNVAFVCAVTIAAAAIIQRLYLFDAVSADYSTFLRDWLTKMRSLAGVLPITTPIGDYNMPYLYFLFGISKTSLSGLYMIKLLSVIFDFALALSAGALVNLLKKNGIQCICIFATVLFVPTVILNSAYWGQCDTIYTAISLWALYFALSDKPRLSVILFALAFSFKMQAIFILPVIIFLVIKNRIKPAHLLLFPATFITVLIPALACGRSVYETFSIYLDQASSYPSLTLNCPTLWAFFPSDKFGIFGTAALFTAGAAVLVFMLYLYTKRSALNNSLLFDAAFLFVLIMPFLLPRMHERYFYIAEVMSVIYVFFHKRRALVAPALVFTGFCCYSNYLFDRSILPLYALALINAAVVIFVFIKFTDDSVLIKDGSEDKSRKECL